MPRNSHPSSNDMNIQFPGPPRASLQPFAARWSALLSHLSIAVMTGMALFLAGCTEEPRATRPDTLKVGVLPDQSVETIKARYSALVGYLSETLEMPVELIIPDSYDDLLDMFHENKVQLAYFGGVTFVQASKRSNAAPVAMRDIDAKFRSYFLVKADDPAKKITDLEDRTIAFGSRLSTSGHFMPRRFLQESGIIPEDYFSKVAFSGAHDKTAYLVRDGSADIGAANAVVIDTMYADGRLDRKDVRILWETPPYADYVWALQSNVPESFLIEVRDAFLSLSPEDPAHSALLKQLGAGLFEPVDRDDFADLRAIVDQFLPQNPL